jgi:hypothetical protein
MLGMNGIDPNKRSGYTVPGLPSKDMSGCEMLAFYYVLSPALFGGAFAAWASLRRRPRKRKADF